MRCDKVYSHTIFKDIDQKGKYASWRDEILIGNEYTKLKYIPTLP